MLLKDKYKPKFLDEFIINKNCAIKCSKLITKDFIPHLLFHGPAGCGKYTLCKSIINNIYDEEIKTFNSTFKIENKEHTISCSEYHFEIFLDKYSNNKNCLFEIIDYLTATKEINQVCLVKIIVLRNLNYCNSNIFSYLKNKMEVSSNNYRFFVMTNNVSYIPERLRGLFFYVKINYEEEKIIEEFLKYNKIKYDNKFPTPFNYNFMDVNNIMEMKPTEYPEVADLIEQIQNWDRSTDVNSTGAGAYAMFYYTLAEKYFYKSYYDRNFSKDLIADCLKDVKEKMIKYFNSSTVKLGEYQKLVRGNKEIPIFGMPDVITAMTASKYKNGKIQVTHGESYIQLVKFSNKGVEIESIISYGSSDHKDSPHYNDQMELYSKFKTKKMSFDKDYVLKNARTTYNPK